MNHEEIGLLPAGQREVPARSVAKRCLCGRYRPIVGAALFAEYEDVFRRDAVFARSLLSRSERMEVFLGLAMLLTRPVRSSAVVSRGSRVRITWVRRIDPTPRGG